MSRLIIGVDPSGSKAGTIGVCAMYGQTQILDMQTLDFFMFQEWVKHMEYIYLGCLEDEPLAIIEDSNINPGAYNRGLSGKRLGKQNRDLGKNQFASFLCIEWCKKMGFEVIAVSPKQKGGKWTEDWFRKVSKYDKKLLKKHQHAIDAYQVALPYVNKK